MASFPRSLGVEALPENRVGAWFFWDYCEMRDGGCEELRVSGQP